MKRRLVSMGIALLTFAALSAVNVVIFRGMAELSRLESRNDSEQTLNALFAGLRIHDDFGSAIESTESLKRKIIGVSVTGSDGRILYSWGTVSEPLAVPASARTYIENPSNSSLVLLLRPSRDNPPPPPPAEDGGKPGPRPASSFMRDTLRQAELIALEIRQPVFWRAARTRTVLFPAVELTLAALVIFVHFLIVRNGEYRRRIEQQKNLVMLGTAASTLAHEIKNPLLAIRLQTGILERTLPREGLRELEIINSEVSRLSTLSHRVNDILRDPIGRPADVNPTDIAREVGLRLCGRDLVHGLPEAPMLHIDPERLRSILENLLRNALESGGREEEVAIEIEASNGRVQIDVLDRGKGVTPGDRERIFDPFFTTKSSGSGIGLTICRRFVHAAGGTIAIDSRPEGGSIARLRLPHAADIAPPGGRRMKVLIVDDEQHIRESIQRLFALEGIEAVASADGREAAAWLAEQAFDAVILDLKMPGMDGQELLEWIRAEGLRTPVIMISALGDINDAVKALKSGACDYLMKPFDPAELILKVKAVVSSRKSEDRMEAGARTAADGARLVGESAAARSLDLLIEKIASGNTTVRITGESGTGKEVVAREIHASSPNSVEPFVAVNIGGIHEHLIESELFGHEKGAFTGAQERKPGLFELAGAGTLFLDEIGEMPLPLQVKLLRVIQERKTRRLGGTRDIPIEARIISATNKDIEALVREGRFREDLYYRLNVVRVAVPPLRERKADIPLLAGYLLERIRARLGKPPKKLSAEAIDALMDYPFPGNIRELENILERAMIICEDEVILATDLDLHRSGPKRAFTEAAPIEPAEPAPAGPAPATSMTEVERAAIARALKKWNGNRTKAAAELGISRRTILYKIKRYGLS